MSWFELDLLLIYINEFSSPFLNFPLRCLNSHIGGTSFSTVLGSEPGMLCIRLPYASVVPAKPLLLILLL